jgi:hypothetical protein
MNHPTILFRSFFEGNALINFNLSCASASLNYFVLRIQKVKMHSELFSHNYNDLVLQLRTQPGILYYCIIHADFNAVNH